jgi:hypothetical protein
MGSRFVQAVADGPMPVRIAHLFDSLYNNRRPMARRLAQIAEEINARFPLLVATIQEGYCNTDRKLAGTRLIHRGKGRRGNRLIVRWRNLPINDPQAKVFDHNAAETYRRNEEVEEWVRSVAPTLVKTPNKTNGAW